MPAAQAQKEFIINEALARLDMLLHICVEGTADTPPISPVDGESWIVGPAATGDWASQVGDIASWQASNWVFATPALGMTILDKSTGNSARFDNGWQYAAAVPTPSGGTTEDTEARAAIAGLIDALIAAGILSGN